MLFSVILPIYKVENYLRECIESVLKQKFTDYELILVDDGSPDSCPQICDEYSAKYDFVKTIHKENGGLSDARNAGVPHAVGDYIVFIDSDDFIGTDDFLTKLAQKANDNPDVIVYKFKKYFESKGTPEQCTYSLSGMEEFKTIAEAVEELVRRDAFYCSAWSKCIRRDILVSNNIEFKKGILGEDIEWYYRVMAHVGKIDFIDEAFIIYRQRENSISSSGGEKNLFDNLTTLEYWSRELYELQIDDVYRMALIKSMAKLYSNLLISYSRGGAWKRQYKSRIKALHTLLENSPNPRAMQINKVYSRLGFDATILMLKIYSRIK